MATKNSIKNNQLNPQKPDTAILIYILVLASLLLPGVTALIGAVWAFFVKDDADPWLQSHYSFIIRTVIIVIVFIFIGFLVTLPYIFWFVSAIWMGIRMVKGALAAKNYEPIYNPKTFLFQTKPPKK